MDISTIFENFNVTNCVIIALLFILCLLLIYFICKISSSEDIYNKGIKLGHIDVLYDNIIKSISILENSIDREKDSDVLYIITEAKNVCKIAEKLNNKDNMKIFKSVNDQMEAMDRILSTMVKKYANKTVHDLKKETVINEIIREENKKKSNIVDNLSGLVKRNNKNEEPEMIFNIPDKVELPKSVAFNNDMISNLSNDEII